MKIQISELLASLLLVTLLPLTFIPAFSAAYASPFYNATPLATGTFSEDFTTTTYRNNAQTTTFGWGSGVVTNARGYSSQLLDSFMTPGEVLSIDVQGRTLYASINQTSASNAFRLFDISNPSDISQISMVGSWQFQEPVAVSGDLAAMGGGLPGSEGVGFYNVTNPFSPIIGSAIYLDGNFTDLEFQGHYLYVANFDSPSSLSFRVIDVEDPNAPVLLPMGYLSPNVHGLTVEGHFVYLAEGLSGLNIMNITDPRTPIPVDVVNTPGNAMDVIVDGALAFIADGTGGVQIVDISNPSVASIIGSYDTAGEARKLALQGDTLYVADSSNGLVVLDVTDPTHPILIDTIPISYAWDVDLYGEIVCIGGSAGIYTYRVGLGMAMIPLIGVFDGGYEINDVRVQGDVAYVAAGSDGLLTIDVSDPAAPILLDNYSIGVTDVKKLDVQGNIAVLIEESAVHVFNVLDPSNIQVYQQIPAAFMTDAFLFGELCFYSYSNGLGFLNISNPYTYTYYQISYGTNITAIWVQGSYLYAVDYLGAAGPSFYIYDISDLTNWQLISAVPRQGYHYDIIVDGDVAYLADDRPTVAGWATTYDVTDPWSALFGQDLYNETLGVWVLGPWLVTADQHQGVSLHNTTDIYAMTTLNTNVNVNRAR
ncbi:MAG: LVIVD repeat-containing protein, partial [Promethearchaeota archaeon]